MDSTDAPGLEIDIDGLRECGSGTHLGWTDWREMTQPLVNQFADVTDDHNYIHVDVERANSSPFGGTIAHGYLTLSLLAPVTQQLLRVTDASTGINYGLDRVRFPAPLPVDIYTSRKGISVEIGNTDAEGRLVLADALALADEEKPALVAECLVRVYR